VVPNELLEAVKAIHSYDRRRDDELSFKKGDIIHNVKKIPGGWWQGDFGDLKGYYFPETFVKPVGREELASHANLRRLSSFETTEDDNTALGNMIDGYFELEGLETTEEGEGTFRLYHPTQSPNPGVFIVEAKTLNESRDWLTQIREAQMKSAFLSDENSNKQEQKVTKSIAQELSDIVVYCRMVPFKEEEIRDYWNKNAGKISGNYYDMSSVVETKIEKFSSDELMSKIFLQYHELQFTRVYPRGNRVDSSNYDPMLAWILGSQMCALNYQTPDKSMQINHARFLQNGGRGYVLSPAYMREKGYFPKVQTTVMNLVEPMTITIKVLSGRHIHRPGREIAKPLVEIEIIGAEYDCNIQKTTSQDHGFHPVWAREEPFVFDLANPDIALIRFAVQDEDVFGEPYLTGQATYPVKCLRSGYRCIPLKNGYSELLELSSLLVNVEISNPRLEEADSQIYASVQDSRKTIFDLSQR
jgi:phosphatidylinositol phospholipase C gamma-1